MRDKPITADELDKAKNQLAAGFVFGLQTVDGIAQALGHAQYVEGDWKRFVEGATRYLAVTAADVQRVAKKYLIDTNLTRVTLAQPVPPVLSAPPATEKEMTGPSARVDDRAASRRSRAPVLAGCASAAARPRQAARHAPDPSSSSTTMARPAGKTKPGTEYWAGRKDLIHSPAPPKPAELALPPVQRFTLKNGLQVVIVPRKDLPVVSFGIAVQAGGYDERRDTLGVSDFVAAMLRARHQDAQRRRHLERDRLRRRVAGRAGLERGHERRLFGAVEGRQAVPRPAVGHPAAPVVPRERDGRGARRDAGGGRGPLRQPARAGERALREPAVRREASRRVDSDAPRTSARSRGRAWRVLEDVLPPEPRHPRRRRRRRRGEAARRNREGVRRLGARRGAGPADLDHSRRSRGRASCSSIGPTRRRRRSCSAIRGSSTPIRAGTRRR